jgi:prolyl-tRNA synthetase
MAQKVTPQDEDFSRWYTDVVQMAELADYSPVRGSMVIRPYGYTLWENMVAQMDRRFKEAGHVNAYFPLLIPESFLKKEAQHVEGFAPELAVVTHGGGKELEEPLVVRPTSETIIGYMYAKWIKSYRDLPVLINQWSNVVRWEMRTRLFLRTMEFLWQEGHTAHATAEEAWAETLRILDVYTDFAETECAVPVVKGRKSDSEKFAGAHTSYTIEAMMRDTRALQSGTSHYMDQNFARAFDIRFLDQNNELQYCYTTSWGVSTRMIGAVIMTHGDDQGLRLPPRIAPYQVVIVPIWRKDNEKSRIMETVDTIHRQLRDLNVRVMVDDREELSPGFKFNDWEMRGVPVRMEIGPKDLEKEQVVLARRDQPDREGKQFVSTTFLSTAVPQLLTDIQRNLFQQAKDFREVHSVTVDDYETFKEAVKQGFVKTWACDDKGCEDKIQEDTKATNRCFPLDQPNGSGRCIVCDKEADEMAIFARAY